jgi:hypothetical protein
MSQLIASLLVLALAYPATLVAQAAPTAATLAPGARVRVTTSGSGRQIGTVVAHRGDTLLVRWPEFANAVAVPLDGVSRLEVSTGRHRRVVKGLMLGTAIGGVTGVLIGAASYEPCDSTEFMGCFLGPTSRGESAAVVGVAGGVLGLVVGSLAGLARHERWKPVSLGERRVAFAVTPRAHGTRLGVSLQF